MLTDGLVPRGGTVLLNDDMVQKCARGSRDPCRYCVLGVWADLLWLDPGVGGDSLLRSWLDRGILDGT